MPPADDHSSDLVLHADGTPSEPTADSAVEPDPAPVPIPWDAVDVLDADLLAVKKQAYDPARLDCSDPVDETTGEGDVAYAYTVGGAEVRFRGARPARNNGAPVSASCKKDEDGLTKPFDAADPVDLIVISVRDTVLSRNFGQFVFPREVLVERKIVSTDGVGGKRGFRVYPPWVQTKTDAEASTQAWQLEFFLRIDELRGVDTDKVRRLYSL
jgi:hypothetical protein